MWDCQTQGIDCGDAAAQWVSEYLGSPGLRMVFYSHELEDRNYVNEAKPWHTSANDTDVVSVVFVLL